MGMRNNYEFSIECFDPAYEHYLEWQNGMMLGLGVTTACNYDCQMCFYHDKGHSAQPDFISIDLVETLLGNLQGLSLLNISLQGEPFLHPGIFEILEIARNYANKTVICTNGSLLDSKMCQKLREYPSLMLAISVDACDAKTFSTIRKGGNFDSVINNIRRAINTLGEDVALNFVLCRQNMESLERLPELVSGLGVRKVNLSMLREVSLTKATGLTPLMLDEAQKLVSTLEARCHEKDVALCFEGTIGKPCFFPFYYTSILADGKLFPCCGDFMPDTVEKYDFDGIFNHPYLRRLRGALLLGKDITPCKKCLPN